MKRWSTFTKDAGGNVLMITGLAFLVLIIAAGMGIDFGRQQLLRVRMQQSSDAAALAAGAAPAGIDKQQTANRYFNLNFTPSYLGFDRPAPSVNVGTNVTVETSGKLATAMMGYNGVKDMNASGRSVVGADTVNANQSYDVILVMDNSASMDTTDVGSSDTLNADSGAPCRNWLFFVPGNQVCAVNGTTRMNALRYSAVHLTQQLLNPNRAHSRVGAITWSTVNEELQTTPLTEDYNTIRSFLGQMISFESTNSTTGMGAAQTMANNFRPDSVRAIVLLTDGFNTMASTFQSQIQDNAQPCHSDASKVCPKDQYGCDGAAGAADICTRTNIQTLPICTNFKDHGVLVYTIAFGKAAVSDPNAAVVRDFLANCASGTPGSNENQYFFIAPDADTLDNAFKAIITSIGKIRIKE